MRRIDEDIRSGSLKTVYVLFGQEAYLQRQYRDKLIQAAMGDGDNMNLRHIQGKDFSIPQLIDFAETLPFFADHRVIVLEGTGLLKSGGEELARYLESPCDTTIWILVDSECDKRSKLFKSASKAGLCVEFGEQDENTLKKWILSILKKENKQITARTMELFLEKAGTDMSVLRLELEKLLCYTMDKDVIEAQDVEEICITRITSHIFDMVDAIGVKDQTRALALYNELQALREPPIRILFLIGRHMNLLLQIKDLKKRGMDNKAMAAKAGVPPFVVNKYIKQASLYKTGQLKEALAYCIQADQDIKTGLLQDKMSVELLIFTLTGSKAVKERESNENRNGI